ncbi:MAG: chorismate synthase [Capsulimonadales bacterium]|nr:chorismate synthase [Capsulimonadales bacterium]
MFRFLTAGESHGPALVTLIEGLPAGLPLTAEAINLDLRRRQGGYGRGARQKIETDTVEILNGIRLGRTLGSPVTLVIRNRDWENWKTRMRIEPAGEHEPEPAKNTVPRPGHADYVGMVKYAHDDLRNVLERSSARNTATLVAVGAVARQLLAEFDVSIVSHVTRIGSISAAPAEGLTASEIVERSEASPVRCIDPAVSEEMVTLIDGAKRRGDTLGGVFEVIAFGLPVGLGSYVHWDRKIDGRLAQAVLSINAIKGVEIGMGFAAAETPGSKVHDEFAPGGATGVRRLTNRAGGTEGGVTNGEPLIVRAAMKPIATLMRQLGSVDMATGEAAPAFAERSDVCAVPAAAVIGEAMVAIVLAQELQEKFGGDSLQEMRRNYRAFQATYHPVADGVSVDGQ